MAVALNDGSPTSVVAVALSDGSPISVVALNWRRVALNEKLTSKTQKRYYLLVLSCKVAASPPEQLHFLVGFDLRRNKYVSSLREKFICVPSKIAETALLCAFAALLARFDTLRPKGK